MHQPVSECGMDLVVECGAGEGRGTDVVQTISPTVSDPPQERLHHLRKATAVSS